MKVDQMADLFPNLGSFAPRCQKFVEHLSFFTKYFDLDLKEKSEKINFISPKILLL
jgi:hypothetical protein